MNATTSHGFGRPPALFVTAAVLLLAAWSTALAAQTLPKLPEALQIARGADSPGQVIFNHASHVDVDKPSCTGCHPREFRILKETRRPAIKHADMEKGRQCGACHDGKRASAMDDCTLCHAS
jgi:c(7)-type cytochrome triheme protein